MNCKLVLAILFFITSEAETNNFCEYTVKTDINFPILLTENGSVFRTTSKTISIPFGKKFIISCAPEPFQHSNETYFSRTCGENYMHFMDFNNITCTKPVIRQALISNVVCEDYGKVALVLSYWNPIENHDLAIAGICLRDKKLTGLIAFRYDFIISVFMKELFQWKLQDFHTDFNLTAAASAVENKTQLFTEKFLGNTQFHTVGHFEWNQLEISVENIWNALQTDIGNFDHKLLLSIQIKSYLLIGVLDTINDTLHEFTVTLSAGKGLPSSRLIKSNCSQFEWLKHINEIGNHEGLTCEKKLKVGRTKVVDIIENIKDFLNTYTNFHV